MKKRIFLFLAMTLLLSACGNYSVGTDTASRELFESESGADWDYKYGIADEYAPAPSDAPALSADGSTSGETTMSGNTAVPSTGKLIRTAKVTMETMDYDTTLTAIEELVAQYDGYIQASSTTGTGAIVRSYQVSRTAQYTLRIPAEGFFGFYEDLTECGSVTNRNQNAQEVSDYYYDTEARLKTLRLQEERLLTLMSQATELEAIITLENTLADVRYQIESHEGTLRQLDSKIAYSTFELSITEVFEPTQYVPVATTLGQRISQRFQSTWDGLVDQGETFLVWLLGESISILLTLALFAAVFFILRMVYRRWKTRLVRKPASPKEKEDREE